MAGQLLRCAACQQVYLRAAQTQRAHARTRQPAHQRRTDKALGTHDDNAFREGVTEVGVFKHWQGRASLCPVYTG